MFLPKFAHSDRRKRAALTAGRLITATWRLIIVAWLVSLGPVSLDISSARAAEWRLTDRTRIRLATVEEGRTALAKRDVYIRSLSALDRQVRLRTDMYVSEQRFLDHTVDQVLAWDEAEAEKIRTIVGAIRAKLMPWHLPLPPAVLLVKTTGCEEDGAAYCRGAVVVLSQDRLAASAEQLERTLLHELFHVLSNHNHDLRRRLYAVVGFRPCTEIELPAELAARRLTNPDAPENNYYTEVTHEGRTHWVAPLLYAEQDEYDPQLGGLFEILKFSLVSLKTRGDRWRVRELDGKPLLLNVADVPDYYEQIGRNTKYIIHPEEVLADNFVLLVGEKQDVPTPRVLEGMRAVLEDEPENVTKEGPKEEPTARMRRRIFSLPGRRAVRRGR